MGRPQFVVGQTLVAMVKEPERTSHLAAAGRGAVHYKIALHAKAKFA